MYPTINVNKKRRDYVFLLRPGFGLHGMLSARPIEDSLRRGEVVSFVNPKDPDECLIKRVVGLPGDIVKTYRYKRKYVLVFEALHKLECRIFSGKSWRQSRVFLNPQRRSLNFLVKI